MGLIYSFFSPIRTQTIEAIEVNEFSAMTSCVDVSNSICKYITHETDGHFPTTLLHVCMNYVGYLMYSNILSNDEKLSCYNLLLSHHYKINIKRSLLTYFHLFYRSLHGINIRDLKAQCVNKCNVLVVFHTDYDHVFCVYYPKIALKLSYENENACVMLLRSQFIDNGAKCPRMITIKRHDMWKKACFFTDNVLKDGYLYMGDIGFDKNKCSMLTFDSILEFSGNEICGGPSFNGNDPLHEFKLLQVEMFQILY
eukprot:149568_1